MAPNTSDEVFGALFLILPSACVSLVVMLAWLAASSVINQIVPKYIVSNEIMNENKERNTYCGHSSLFVALLLSAEEKGV
jgi:hypothetical protein